MQKSRETREVRGLNHRVRAPESADETSQDIACARFGERGVPRVNQSFPLAIENLSAKTFEENDASVKIMSVSQSCRTIPLDFFRGRLQHSCKLSRVRRENPRPGQSTQPAGASKLPQGIERFGIQTDPR